MVLRSGSKVVQRKVCTLFILLRLFKILQSSLSASSSNKNVQSLQITYNFVCTILLFSIVVTLDWNLNERDSRMSLTTIKANIFFPLNNILKMSLSLL